ncbi:MAG TPA: carboxymuconolactone decarboxylase family protein [Polyangiales bacterium]|nr:carboxymuconolactone decarboxylase family protein [Polyangiales bacterium]
MHLALPAAAADVSRNLERVLSDASSLNVRQRWGVALASAYASRSRALSAAVKAEIDDASVIEDARVAAVLMAQNNVFFRFRHLLAKPSYQAHHSRLAMSKRSEVANKADYELFALAVSAIHGCESCIQHHEQAALALGLREEQANDAVRIASVIHATAVALELD